jgi:hypothetical protein
MKVAYLLYPRFAALDVAPPDIGELVNSYYAQRCT